MRAKIGHLKAIAKVLDGVMPRQFDITRWESREPPSGCGFAGCAIGWASYKNVLPSRLKMVDRVPVYTTDAKELRNFSAVSAALGISKRDAEWLFSSGDYRAGVAVEPSTVARRIRQFVREKQAAAA